MAKLTLSLWKLRYNTEKIVNSASKIDKATKIKNSIETTDYTIYDEFITKNEKGNLVYRYKVRYKNKADIVDVLLD